MFPSSHPAGLIRSRCHIDDLERCVSRLFITITITIVCWCILIRQIPPRILLFPTQYPTVCVRSCNTWFFPPSFHLSQSCINFRLCTHLFTPLRGSSIHASIALFPLVHHRPLTLPHPPSLFLTLILYKSSPLILPRRSFIFDFSLILYRNQIENGSHCIQSVVFMKMTAWFFLYSPYRLSNMKNGR